MINTHKFLPLTAAGLMVFSALADDAQKQTEMNSKSTSQQQRIITTHVIYINNTREKDTFVQDAFTDLKTFSNAIDSFAESQNSVTKEQAERSAFDKYTANFSLKEWMATSYLIASKATQMANDLSKAAMASETEKPFLQYKPLFKPLSAQTLHLPKEMAAYKLTPLEEARVRVAFCAGINQLNNYAIRQPLETLPIFYVNIAKKWTNYYLTLREEQKKQIQPLLRDITQYQY